MQQADKVTWFELPADDIARAGEFYSTVFGWQTSDMGMGDGSLFAQTAESGPDMQPKEAGTINGDIAKRSQTFSKPHIVVTVDNLDAKLDTVLKSGGKIVQPKNEVEGMMAYAIIADTEGNTIGVIQNY